MFAFLDDMQLPNTLGFVFGIIQMVVYLIYRNATPVVEAPMKGQELSGGHIIDVVKIGTDPNRAGGGAGSKV